MKHLIFALSFISAVAFGASKEKVVSSTIKQVTVYQQGAQITRKSSYSVSKGTSVIIIEGISPSIDPRSLQVKTSGDAVLLESKYNIFYPQPEVNPNPTNAVPAKIIKAINLLQDSIADVQFNKSDISLQIEVLQSEKLIIANNGTIKGEGKVNDSIPLLQDAIAFYHTKMNEINKSILILQRDLNREQKDLNRMNMRLTNLNNYNYNNGLTPPGNKPPVHRLEITLSSLAAASGRIEVSYLVGNAGWIPLYDIRSEASQQKIDLTYKAQVYQNTGIDWENVKLNLSTNNPYTNKTKPTLNPWYLDYYAYQYKDNRAKKSTTGSAGLGYNAPTTAYLDSEESVESADDVSFDWNGETSANFTQIIEQLISVEYKIDLNYDIKSDNKKNMVLIDTKNLKTEYMHYAVPKLDLSVYLVARITDLESLNLVPGKANLFHDGSYLGETYLNPSVMSDTLDLSLGKDPNVIIKRTLIKKETKEKIVGDKIVKTMAWNIEIKNQRNKTIPIIIEDQIPVSRNSEIEIEIVDVSKAKLNEISGILTWNMKLRSGANENLKVSYTVKYDKTQNIDLVMN